MNKCESCPYRLRYGMQSTCVWNGRTNPKGCRDQIVRIFRIMKGEVK